MRKQNKGDAQSAQPNAVRRDAEKCPFDARNIFHANKYVRAIHAWTNVAPTISIGEIAASVAILELVDNEEEFIETTTQLAFGKIHQRGTQYSVDTNTKKLGRRRVNLHPVTSRITARFKPNGLTEADVLPAIEHYFAEMLGEKKAALHGQTWLSHMLKLARALSAQQLSGTMRAWTEGSIHARTTWPSTMARHQFNVIEHPYFPAGKIISGGRGLRSDKPVRDAIAEACAKHKEVTSNETKLDHLQKRLSQIRSEINGSIKATILLKYAVHLCGKVRAPSTIARYYDEILPLVEEVAEAVEHIEQLRNLDWPALSCELLESDVPEEGSDGLAQAALNHFFELFGIEYRIYQHQDPALAARRYVELLSPQEIQRAIDISSTLDLLPEPRRQQPAMCIRTGAVTPIRRQELADRRDVDISFDVEPYLVINKEAGGSLKSVNASRVLSLGNVAETSALRDLRDLRRLQSANLPGAYLFGDAADVEGNQSAEKVLETVALALKLATGSSDVSIRTLRQTAITARVHAVLSPAGAISLGPLELRQALPAAAAAAGHGSFTGTTMPNYCAEFEKLRRDCADNLLRSLKVEFSREFMSAVTGTKEDTYKKRVDRGTRLSDMDFMEGFDPTENSHFSSRVIDVSTLVVGDTTIQLSDSEPTPRDQCRASAVFAANVVMGVPDEVAGYSSQIDMAARELIKRGLGRIAKAFGQKWCLKTHLDPMSISRAPEFAELARHLGGWDITIDEALYVASLIGQRVDGPWPLPDETPLHELTVLFAILSAAGFEADISLSKSKDSSADLEKQQLIKALGYPNVKTIARRHFSKGQSILLGFLPTGSTTRARPRLSGKATFFVTANVLAVCAALLGRNS